MMGVLKVSATCLFLLMIEFGQSSAITQVLIQDHPRTESSRQEHHLDDPIKVTGVLTSRKRTSLKNRTGHDAVIVDIVPDRSIVNEGEVVIQLDDSLLRQKLAEQRIEIQMAQSEIDVREKLAARLKSQLESDIDVARKQQKVAELNYSRFFGKNGKQERAIVREQQLHELAVKQKELLEQRRNAMKVNAQNRLDLEEIELQIKSHELEIGYHEKELQALQGPESDYRRSELELATFEAKTRAATLESNLHTVNESALSDLESLHLMLAEETETLKTLEQQISACKIRAPKGGNLHYATHRDIDFRIEPGETVRELEEIAFIPDMSQLQLEVQLTEAQVAKAQIGQAARITFQSIPLESFHGAILIINNFPESRTWRSRQTFYKAFISVDQIPEGLELGTQATVELSSSR